MTPADRARIALLARLRDTRAWLAPEDIAAAADLIEALGVEVSRAFAEGYEIGRAVGAVEGQD